MAIRPVRSGAKKKTKGSKSGQAEGREDSRGVQAPPARSGPRTDAKDASGRRESERSKGRGRPPFEDTQVVTVRLPGALLESVEAVVKESGHVYRDRSEFIRQAVAKEVQEKAREFSVPSSVMDKVIAKGLSTKTLPPHLRPVRSPHPYANQSPSKRLGSPKSK